MNPKGMQELAVKYGKHDLERLGIFIEMPYMNGKGYVSPFPKPRPDKGRNIIGDGRKSKCGTQHGYFDDTFRRLYEGEAIKRPPKRKNEEKEKKKNKISGLPFMPAGSTKLHSCPGDHYGTFGGIVEAFSRVARPKPPYKRPKPNCLTNPCKKGGTGYANICINKYPEHLPDPYRSKIKYKQYGQNLGRPIVTVHFPQPCFEKNPFREESLGPLYMTQPKKPQKVVGDGKWIPTGPTKWQGGCHAGMFERFPEYMTNRDPKRDAKNKKEKMKLRSLLEEKGKFCPQSMAMKTLFTPSILIGNTEMCVNATNYKVYEPVYTKHLLSKI